MKIAPAILEEARRLNIPIPESGYEPSDFPTATTCEMLDSDVDDMDKDQQKQHIVKIASEFLSIAGNFDQLGFYEPYDIQEIRAIVPEKVNEVEIRRFEMLVHNLQSSFDTYVIHGGYPVWKAKADGPARTFFSCFSSASDDRAVSFIFMSAIFMKPDIKIPIKWFRTGFHPWWIRKCCWTGPSITAFIMPAIF